MAEPIRAVDLFCGGGGLSEALVQALRNVAIDAAGPTEQLLREHVDLVAVNHDEHAIRTHEANHPWARHYCDDIENVNPRDVFDEREPDVKILSGGIECTFFSKARGGKPLDEQDRMPAWDTLTWIQKLRPDCVLFENVEEFSDWGPLDEDGRPTRTGEVFESWVNSLHALGYSVEWDVLNAADYGDATSRDRLFILARRDGKPEFPEPTHSDERSDLPDRRTAADIIDWSDRGGSIWTRDLTDGRRKPLKYTTMARISEGIRRHCDDRLKPFADALDSIGRVAESDDVDPDDFLSVEGLRSRIVPAAYAPVVAATTDDPFLALFPGAHADATATDRTGRCSSETYLLRQQSGGVPSPMDWPTPTISSAGAVARVDCQPLVMPKNGLRGGLHSNTLFRPADRPMHTITADPRAGLVTPSLVPYYSERAGQRPRNHGLDAPLPTVTATGSDPCLSTPFLIQYHGQSGSHRITKPTPTITTRDSLALVVPELWPYGLDIRYRMLKPKELAAAQGFPEDYEFHGTKTKVKEQIGNAVPVNLAQAVVEALLSNSSPALTDYLDDDPAATTDKTAPATGGAASDD